MAEARKDDYRATSTGYQANHLARLFSQALAEALRPLDLAPAQFIVLIELWQNAPETQRDLMTRLDVEQATMGNTLKRMERDGLITRAPNPADQRSALIQLSARAKSLEVPAKAAAAAVNAAATSGLAPAEMDSLGALMRRVIGALQAHRDGA